MTTIRATRLPSALLLLIASLSSASAQATDPHAGHAMMSPAENSSDSPATAAFKAASAAMHSTMDIPYTGNPDIDFIAGMIPHHQGAVDAARIVLQYGSDPEVKAFAQTVIDAQEAEIAWMTDWLAKQGK